MGVVAVAAVAVVVGNAGPLGGPDANFGDGEGATVWAGTETFVGVFAGAAVLEGGGSVANRGMPGVRMTPNFVERGRSCATMSRAVGRASGSALQHCLTIAAHSAGVSVGMVGRKPPMMASSN